MKNKSEMSEIWRMLLNQISKEVLTDRRFTDGNLSIFLSVKQLREKWLGFTGASEDELQRAEQKLGRLLPPSYRRSLSISNGFGPVNAFIWRLKDSAEIDWLVNLDEEMITIWEKYTDNELTVLEQNYFSTENMRNPVLMQTAHLRGCLMISDWGDAGFLALNPAVQHNGEWEAWHFANWHPGAVRYRSFTELMQQTLLDYQKLKAGDSQP